jgi:hypothetical protein
MNSFRSFGCCLGLVILFTPLKRKERDYLVRISNHSSKPMQRAKPNPMAARMSLWLSFIAHSPKYARNNQKHIQDLGCTLDFER